MKVNLSWMRARLSGAASFQYHTGLEFRNTLGVELVAGKALDWDVQGRKKSLILACECARVQLAEVRAAVLGPWLAQQLV